MKKLLLSIFLSITLITSIAYAEFKPDLIITSPNGIWTDSRAYATLNDAISAVGANERTIKIVSPQTVTDLTIPSNVTLGFERNGSITNSGQLTINTKNIRAPNRQIFTGTGDIDFTDGSVVRSAWFSSISSALDLTNDDSLTLVISKQTSVWNSCAVGNNVTLKWESPNNILTARSGVVVSNIKNIDAGNYQLFGGPGDFDFLDGTQLKLNWFTRLRSALAWVEDEEVTIIVSEDSIVQFDITAASNEHIKVIPGGELIPDVGITLTIGSFECGLWQAFSGSGVVTFGTGAAKTLHPEWWGDNTVPGTTDMTDEIQAAIDAANGSSGNIVQFLATQYKVTSLVWKEDVYLLGIPSFTDDTTNGSWLIGTPGDDVLTLEYNAINTANNFRLRGLSISSGENQIVSTDETVWLFIDDCRLSGPVEASIATRGFMQQWFINNLDMTGGKYGWRAQNLVGLNGGAANFIDKCSFKNIRSTGHSENGFRIEVANSNTVTWESITVSSNTKSGFYLDGGATNWTFINYNNERNHYGGAKVVTTGSITNGTNTLTVASGVGISDGDNITIRGAAASGKDLPTTVASGGGTVNIVTADNALNTVTNMDVTNALYDNFEFNNTVATPTGITFIDFQGSTGVGGDSIRYDINCTKSTKISVINGRMSTRGIYDPSQAVSWFGGTGELKLPLLESASDYKESTFPERGKAANVGSPRGGNIVLGLVDSNGNTTGTFGNVEIRKYNANRDRVWYIDADDTNYPMYMRGNKILMGNTSARGIFYGSGSPENVLAAYTGSLYIRSDGGVGTSFYVKETGTGNTGWAAK